MAAPFFLDRNEFFTGAEFMAIDENNDNLVDADEFLFDDFLA